MDKQEPLFLVYAFPEYKHGESAGHTGPSEVIAPFANSVHVNTPPNSSEYTKNFFIIFLVFGVA